MEVWWRWGGRGEGCREGWWWVREVRRGGEARRWLRVGVLGFF